MDARVAPPSSPARPAVRWLGLVIAMAAISALHYATPPGSFVLHPIYQRLYYVPIIVAAYWFGPFGGLLAAVASSIAYAPHIHTAWSHNPPYTVSQYAELVVFVSLGLSVGLIASRLRRLSDRHREAAESLERANLDLRQSAEQLRRAERLSALGEIAAGLAHEIRNPLAGVKGALEIVSSRITSGTPEAEFAGIATRELQRLEGLVQEFLDYARPRAPQTRPTDMAEVARRAVVLLTPEADRAKVGLRVVEGEAPTRATVDAEQVQQVLVNVVLNAIHASRAGATVTVECRTEAGRCHVTVRDEGAGIPADIRPRIFEPFFTTKERGTGLGLAISQRIVTAHGGDITIDSREGQGTTVSIVLPLAGPEQRANHQGHQVHQEEE